MKDYSQIATENEAPFRQDAVLLGYSVLSRKVEEDLRSYHEMLKDDLSFSGNSDTAEQYLTRSAELLENLSRPRTALISLILGRLKLERLSLKTLMGGYLGYLQKEFDFQLEEEISPSLSFSGEARIFGMMLREMCYAIQEFTEGRSSIRCHVSARHLQNSDFVSMAHPLPDGKYVLISLDSGSEPSQSLREQIPLEQLLLQKEAFPMQEELQESLLFWYGAVQLMKGEIFLSPSGALSSLQILFPACQEESSTDWHAREKNGRQETILLVDDEDMIWDVIVNVLQNLGYTVLLAENGQDAVDIYKENTSEIDLVLLDMRMPVLGGREAFHQLKQINPQVKVLLSSGYVREEDAADVLQNGACGFLRKPYPMRELAQKIREILSE